MNTTAVYDPDEVLPRNSPLLAATAPILQPLSSPPQLIAAIRPSSPWDARKKAPSLADTVLISFMGDGRRLDIAALEGKGSLPANAFEEWSDGTSNNSGDEEVLLVQGGRQRSGQSLNIPRDNPSDELPIAAETLSPIDTLRSMAVGALTGLASKDTIGDSEDGIKLRVVELGLQPESVRGGQLGRDDRPQPIARVLSPSKFHRPYSPSLIPTNPDDPRSSNAKQNTLPPVNTSPVIDTNRLVLPSIWDQLGDFGQFPEVHSRALSDHFPGALGNHDSPISPQQPRQDYPCVGQAAPSLPPSAINNIGHQEGMEFDSGSTEDSSFQHSGPTVATRRSPHSTPLHGSKSLDEFPCRYPGCQAPPFSDQYLLKSHANVHSLSRPYYCQVKTCPRGQGGKGFKRKNEMRRHSLTHEQSSYVCPFCPREKHKYPRRDNLRRHVNIHHQDKDKNNSLLLKALGQPSDIGGPSRRRMRGPYKSRLSLDLI